MKPATLTPAEMATVRDRIAAGDTAADIAALIGMVRKTLLAAVKRYNLGPWLVLGADRRPAPADFAEMAMKMSNPQLAKHYTCGTCLPARWRKELGLGAGPRMKTGPRKQQMPADFATWAPGKSLREIGQHYGMSHEAARRFRTEAGIDAPPVGFQRQPAGPLPLGRERFMTAPVNRAVRDGSRAGMAADYLRKFGAVFRCTAMGVADTKGTHWCRGSAILTDAEIVQRAEYNGWQPDAWKQVRAA